MGLDMFLHATRFLWHNEESKKKAIASIFPEIGDMEPKRVQIEAMYWRKANQIHSWFVRKCQGGVDECQNTDISRDQIKALIDDCKAVLADPSKAKAILEPQGGFFFGPTDIDEYYFKDLQDTVDGLEKALQLPNDWGFEYNSSW